MITLMLLITSIWRVEGNSDWRESAFKIQSFDCNTPAMINKLHLPEVCFIPEKKLAEELAAAQSGWISVSTRVLQVKTPAPMEISSSYKPSETLTTLYTMEELKTWESYHQLPSYEKSQHQRLLNVLCNEDSCSYGGQSALAGMNLDEFKKPIQEGSEAMLASLNPFGAGAGD